MEKYFVIEITKTKDSDVYASGVTVKEDADPAKALRDAKMLYHQTLASVYANANIEHAIVRIDNFYGTPVLLETIIPEPEPEPEPEEIEEGE